MLDVFEPILARTVRPSLRHVKHMPKEKILRTKLEKPHSNYIPQNNPDTGHSHFHFSFISLKIFLLNLL